MNFTKWSLHELMLPEPAPVAASSNLCNGRARAGASHALTSGTRGGGSGGRGAVPGPLFGSGQTDHSKPTCRRLLQVAWRCLQPGSCVDAHRPSHLCEPWLLHVSHAAKGHGMLLLPGSSTSNSRSWWVRASAAETAQDERSQGLDPRHHHSIYFLPIRIALVFRHPQVSARALLLLLLLLDLVCHSCPWRRRSLDKSQLFGCVNGALVAIQRTLDSTAEVRIILGFCTNCQLKWTEEGQTDPLGQVPCTGSDLLCKRPRGTAAACCAHPAVTRK